MKVSAGTAQICNCGLPPVGKLVPVRRQAMRGDVGPPRSDQDPGAQGIDYLAAVAGAVVSRSGDPWAAVKGMVSSAREGELPSCSATYLPDEPTGSVPEIVMRHHQLTRSAGPALLDQPHLDRPVAVSFGRVGPNGRHPISGCPA